MVSSISFVVDIINGLQKLSCRKYGYCVKEMAGKWCGNEIVWQESLKPCENADEFARQWCR